VCEEGNENEQSIQLPIGLFRVHFYGVTASLPSPRDASAASAHKLFSFRRTGAIAGNTFRDLVRQKVFYFMIVFALILIGMSLFLVSVSFQGQLQTLMDVSLGAMSVFSMFLAVLATAMLLPKDMEDRTLYTILAKPVARFEYLLGKLCGVIAMLTVAMVLMASFFSAILFVWQGREMDRIHSDYPMAEIAQAEATGKVPHGTSADAQQKFDLESRKLKETTFTPTLFGGIAVILLRAMVIAALTLMVSCFSTSWLFTVIVTFMVVLVGFLVPVARDVWQGQAGIGGDLPGYIKLFLAGVTVFCPDMQIFNVIDDIAAGSVVTSSMFMHTASLGFGYLAVYIFAGYLFFAWREL
jgi:ABC-2 type transport system permease protein